MDPRFKYYLCASTEGTAIVSLRFNQMVSLPVLTLAKENNIYQKNTAYMLIFAVLVEVACLWIKTPHSGDTESLNRCGL